MAKVARVTSVHTESFRDIRGVPMSFPLTTDNHMYVLNCQRPRDSYSKETEGTIYVVYKGLGIVYILTSYSEKPYN